MKATKQISEVGIAELFTYENGWLVWRHRPLSDFATERGWRLFTSRFAGRMAGTQHSAGYWQVNINGSLRLAHRVIWEMHHGPIPKGMEIDHVNRCRTDNRIENLRLVTYSQNQRNRPGSKTDPRMKGIGFDKRRKKSPWSARISDGNAVIFLGVFKTVEEAIAAYEKAAKKLHGEHACSSTIEDVAQAAEAASSFMPKDRTPSSYHRNITVEPGGTYYVRVMIAGRYDLSCHKTLEEAIAKRDALLAERKRIRNASK